MNGTKDYTIYAALTDEVNEGWIWIEEPHLPTRTLVKICKPDTGRAVLTGAFHGIDAIPKSWLDRIAMREFITETADARKKLVGRTFGQWTVAGIALGSFGPEACGPPLSI